MTEWETKISIYNSFNCFAQPYIVSSEKQSKPEYLVRGAERIDNSCIFQYTLSGCGVFQYNNKSYDLTAGTAFLTLAMDKNMQYFYPENAEKPWRFIWLGFIGKTSNQAVANFTSRYGNIFKLDQNCGIIHKLNEFKNTGKKVIEMTPTQGNLLVNKLFSELENSVLLSNVTDPSMAAVVRAQKIINCVTDFRDFSVEDLARKIGISREHLSRLFSQTTGTSLNDHIITTKMHLASRLLKRSKLENKQIAAQLGYASQANFSRSFKKYFNITPSHFKTSGAISVDY